ncbi:MAG TPA: DUF4437 domain-containing protein [Polyangia bacterium]|jgi:anti-sigma factor ChrR (cupin superfamily)|nr:DUF4437 domain-containing protein [Polyangia bacterium]
MTNTTKKRALGVLVLAAVAALSYAAGAAKGKAAVNMSISEMTWTPLMPGGPLNIAKLWGDRDKGEYGMLLKIPAGFESGMHGHTLDYHAVLTQGTWVHTNEGEDHPKELAPGSYVMQPGKQMHNDQCKGTQECITFIHQHGKGDFIPAKAPAGAKPAEKK